MECGNGPSLHYVLRKCHPHFCIFWATIWVFTILFLGSFPVTLSGPTTSALAVFPRVVDEDGWTKIREEVQSYRENNETFKFLDRDVCKVMVGILAEKDLIRYDDPDIFVKDGSGALLNGTRNMTLTQDGCNAICGPMTFYGTFNALCVYDSAKLTMLRSVDSGPRFMTWMLPSECIYLKNLVAEYLS